MDNISSSHRKILDETVEKLRGALGGSLVSLVLYGSAARGDYHPESSDLNLLVLLSDLELSTLRPMRGALKSWRAKGLPPPRILSAQLIDEAADVFPIEFLDVRTHHEILAGTDPFAALRVDQRLLRAMCEREMREKMMRLREGFLECGEDRDFKRLMLASYPSFVALFRGCLHLLDRPVPAANGEASAAFCQVAGVDPAPFQEIERLARGEAVANAPALFERYYAAVDAAVCHIDRFVPREKGTSS